MNDSDLRWCVAIQARYVQRLLSRLTFPVPRGTEVGTFTDSDYDSITNAIDALSMLMSESIDDVPTNESRPVYECGACEGVLDLIESYDD